jgi:hypothetical protein
MEGKNFVEGTIINGIPLMPILIKNPYNSKSTVIELLVDSGAQHTVISKKVLYDTLKFKQDDRIGDRLIQGIIPKKEYIAYCPEFLVDLLISQRWLKQIGVIAFDTSDQGILGKNVLQFFNLELNYLKNAVNFKRE